MSLHQSLHRRLQTTVKGRPPPPTVTSIIIITPGKKRGLSSFQVLSYALRTAFLECSPFLIFQRALYVRSLLSLVHLAPFLLQGSDVSSFLVLGNGARLVEQQRAPSDKYKLNPCNTVLGAERPPRRVPRDSIREKTAGDGKRVTQDICCVDAGSKTVIRYPHHFTTTALLKDPMTTALAQKVGFRNNLPSIPHHGNAAADVMTYNLSA